jgi:hypothetical protein
LALTANRASVRAAGSSLEESRHRGFTGVEGRHASNDGELPCEPSVRSPT